MNNDRYIYANARIAALEATLLNETQLERMISATNADDAFGVLNDTFMAPYIAGRERSYFSRALRKSVSATKRLISSIAPDPELYNILWLRYDFYNVKIVIKGRRAGLDDEALREQCFFAGIYDVDDVIRAVDAGDLRQLHPEMARVYEEVQETENVYEIDLAANRGYFRTARALAEKIGEHVITRYVEDMIDFYNIMTGLRLTRFDLGIVHGDVFAHGGTLRLEELDSEDAILAALARKGDRAFWEESVNEFQKTGQFAILEKAIGAYHIDTVKKHHATIVSSVPLFGYFLQHRNNTEIIKTVMAAKESGMDEAELRRILRRLYA